MTKSTKGSSSSHLHKITTIIKANAGVIRVKVNPHKPTSQIRTFLADQTVKIDLAAAPEKGKANKELQTFLAHLLKIKPVAVRIISGHTDQLKLIRIINHHEL